MKDVNYWKHIILSEKQVEPQSREQEAAYDVAEYMVQRDKTEIAA